jgi:hypothetical protein
MSNLFNYDVNLEPMVMDIRSDTLDPISSNNGLKRYVFRLDANGYLDQNSMLLFKPVANGNNVVNDNFLRVNNVFGGLGAVKRATIQVGDYILNDTDGIHKISALMNMASERKSIQNKYTSQYYKNQFYTKTLGQPRESDSNTGGVGTLILDRHRNGMDFGDIGLGGNANSVINSCAITRTANLNHQIGIPLGALLPCLRGRKIPLFLFQEYRILITIEFNSADEYINNRNNTFGGAGANNNMMASLGDTNIADVKLQVDYIIYPSEIQMEAKNMTNQQGGLRLDFFDIIKVDKSIVASTNRVEQTVEHRIGADNKEVHKIYMTKRFTVEGEDDKLFCKMGIQGIEEEEYNVNIDGIDVFQDDKFNMCSQYNETTNCLGAELQMERPLYINDINTFSNRITDFKHGLLGKYKPLCLDLTNGENAIVGGGRQIGAYPVIWKYKRTADGVYNCLNDDQGGGAGRLDALKPDTTGALNVEYYMLVSRVANITSTNAGTNVVVSY